MEWFRSQDMEFISVILNEDAAHACIRDIGSKGCVQFSDLNTDLTAFQRRYVSSVKRCDELERKVRFFLGQCNEFGIPLTNVVDVDGFLMEPNMRGANSAVSYLEELEAELEKYEGQLLDLNSYNSKLTQQYNEKVELQEVLIKSSLFFKNEIPDLETLTTTTTPLHDQEEGSFAQPLLDGDQPSKELDELRFSCVTGTLPVEDKSRFERSLFRFTRGNCYVRFADIEQPVTDPQSGFLVHKVVFIIFFKSKAIEQKVKRTCDAFGARRYTVPDGGQDNGEAVKAVLQQNITDIKDARRVLGKNRETRHDMCLDIAMKAETWLWTVLREKAVYHTLNLFKADVQGMLRGEGWIVSTELDRVREVVAQSHRDFDVSGASLIDLVPKPWPTPPTYFKLNSFTYPYQEFVDTYGVPRYKEANPAFFTAVTFPFLFGIMYGDIGHGTCLTLGGLYLVLSYNPNKPTGNEMMDGIYSARYMIFMMGAFAVYAGLVYNDMFSLALNLFGSEWEWKSEEPSEGAPANYTEGCSYGDATCVYPFGVDPAWHISSNELLFFNSMKMKMSVILGIIQMCTGIVLRGLNAHYFGEKLDMYFEVIPMIIFAFGMFGYMIVVIFVKWGIDWDYRMYQGTCNEDNANWPDCRDNPDDYTTAILCPLDYGGSGDGCQPPNLITTLINIALSPGTVEEPLYPGQGGVQTVILLLAFCSVPVLLLGKPLAIKYGLCQGERDADRHAQTQLMKDDPEYDDMPHGGDGDDHGHDEHPFSEIVIHQAIETIEFVLGMVSNTASYLRLWALSLAHTELASVFWEKCMLSTINMNNPVAIFVGYAVFAAVTFAVLLAMDVLECFLHALRLHWVEFQNKFYKADGYKFKPFALQPILRAAI